MKKSYLIIVLLVMTVFLRAQTAERGNHKSAYQVLGNPLNGISSSTTTLLMPASALGSCSLTTYAYTNVGYASGTNSYDDKQKGQKYALSTYSLTIPATVNDVSVAFAVAKDGGNGNTLTAKIYGVGTGTALGKPGLQLGTSSNPIALNSVTTGTALTNFTFAIPVNLTSDSFYVFVDISGLNSLAGDSVAVYQSNDGCAANFNGAWEQWINNSFNFLCDPANWPFTSADLMIFPNVTITDITTGIKTNSFNTDNISVSPNPSNGLINVSLTSANRENVTILVTNALGQVVSSYYNSISNDIISLDTSSQTNGVYFVSVSDGKDRIIKKVLLNK